MECIVCIGVPVHNGARYLHQALDALLGQGWRDFRVVALDDGSTDESYSILQQYAQQDARINLFRNSECTGLVAAWNKVAKLAGETCSPKYFAWYADHDWVSPNWLESLVAELEAKPKLALAHPMVIVTDETGVEETVDPKNFDTQSLNRLQILKEATLGYIGAGDLVYGLFRYALLKSLGFLPTEIMPDRLLLSDICLNGDIGFVSSSTRYRRNLSPENYSEVLVRRQLITLFANKDGGPPQFPYLSHATYFIRKLNDFCACEEEAASLRMIQGLLYFQRQRNKFEEEWKQELAELRNRPGSLQALIPLVELALEDEWVPLEYDTKTRLKNIKGLNRELSKELVRIKELNAADLHTLRKAEIKCENLKTDVQRARLAQAIAEVENKEVKDQLQQSRDEREKVEKALAVSMEVIEETERRLFETRQRLEETEKALMFSQDKYQEVMGLLGKAKLHPFKFASIVTYNSSKNFINTLLNRGR